jgi:phosphocarrier protein HPr
VPERTVAVASRVGLHARPAAIFVKAASEQPVPVTIVKKGSDADPVDASSILGIMTLGAEFGEEVVLTAEGDGADAALDALAALLATDLDADDA